MLTNLSIPLRQLKLRYSKLVDASIMWVGRPVFQNSENAKPWKPLIRNA